MTPTPAQLDVLARAERRLTAMIARRGIDDRVLATCATYERLYAATDAPVAAPAGDDLMVMADATRPARHRPMPTGFLDGVHAATHGGAR